jgi:hypothetical protein
MQYLFHMYEMHLHNIYFLLNKDHNLLLFVVLLYVNQEYDHIQIYMFEMFHNILLNQHKMTIILNFYVNVIELFHLYHNNQPKSKLRDNDFNIKSMDYFMSW